MKFFTVTILFMCWFFLFLAIHLININKYGVGIDENRVLQRGQLVVQFLKDPLNRNNQLQFQNKIRKHHHPTFYPTLYYLSAKIVQRTTSLNPIASSQLLNIFVAALGILGLFFFVRLTFNYKIAILACLLLALFPRLIAHFHYNAKNMPAMVLLTLGIFLSYRASQSPGLWTIGSAGGMVGMAMATELNALLIFPIFILSWIMVKFIFEPEFPIGQRLKILLCIAFVAHLGFFIFTPKLWFDPFSYFRSVVHFVQPWWKHTVLYLGQYYEGSHLPWHYSLLYVVLVTPVLMLVLMTVGSWAVFRSLLKNEKNEICLLILCWIGLPIIIRMVPGVTRYDGIRHIFMIVPAMMIVVAWGLSIVMEFFRTRLSIPSNWSIGATMMVVLMILGKNLPSSSL